MKYVCMFSGGLSSFWAAKRAQAEMGPDDEIVLLFADTNMEDEDLYRFASDAAHIIGEPITRLADGRDPWQVFHDVRFLGNSRIDPCSRILKRELMRKWLEKHCVVDDTTVVLGFSWDEAHRVKRAAPFWEPWKVIAPMIKAPYWGHQDMVNHLRADEDIEPPRLYGMGFPHNNCGGFCVKGGQAAFRKLWQMMPQRYLEHEAKEEALRAYLEANVAIMKDRTGGQTKPLTMKVFRERLQKDENQCDSFDWGACSCFDLENV